MFTNDATTLILVYNYTQLTAMKTAFTSDATTLLQKASQPEACQQTLTVPSDESIQTSLGK